MSMSALAAPAPVALSSSWPWRGPPRCEMADHVRCIRSYVVDEPDGRLGSVCIYEARDEPALREHTRRAGLPIDELTRVATSIIINDDPLPAAAVASLLRHASNFRIKARSPQIGDSADVHFRHQSNGQG